MTFPLVFISSTLEIVSGNKKKRLRRISHRALKITLTPFSSNQVYNGIAQGEYDRKSPKCASRVTVNQFESLLG